MMYTDHQCDVYEKKIIPFECWMCPTFIESNKFLSLYKQEPLMPGIIINPMILNNIYDDIDKFIDTLVRSGAKQDDIEIIVIGGFDTKINNLTNKFSILCNIRTPIRDYSVIYLLRDNHYSYMHMNN